MGTETFYAHFRTIVMRPLQGVVRECRRPATTKQKEASANRRSQLAEFAIMEPPTYSPGGSIGNIRLLIPSPAYRYCAALDIAIQGTPRSGSQGRVRGRLRALGRSSSSGW